MKIVIINQHTNNFGDDIAGMALLGELVQRFPQARIEVFYIWTRQVQLPFNHPQVTHQTQIGIVPTNLFIAPTDRTFGLAIDLIFARRHFRQLKKTGYFKVLSNSLIDANFVLVSPCGANIGMYRDWSFLACVRFCVSRGKHVIFHLNTIGDSKSMIFNFMARHTLKRCHMFVRELKSHHYLKKLGISSELGVDSAFLAPKIDTSSRQKMRAITFVPTSIFTWHPDFRNFSEDVLFANIVQELCESANEFRLAIRLLPHMYGEHSEHKDIDSLATKIRQNLAPHLDVSILNPQTAYDYDRAIADSYVVVSMRYHGCILAIKNAVPFVALSYENKMKEACSYADAMDGYLYVKEYRSGQLTSRIRRIVNSYAAMVSTLDARYAALHRMAHKPIDYLEAFLTRKTQTPSIYPARAEQIAALAQSSTDTI